MARIALGGGKMVDLNNINSMNVDLGEVKSRDLGNVTKTLVDIGKEVVDNAAADEYIDYGSLPSRLLTNLGKQAINQQVTETQNHNPQQ